MNYLAALIYRERVRRHWSQEGLCRGICAVSYLSKIERGRAEPSGEILRLLLERLGLFVSEDLEREAREGAEAAYELFFGGCFEELRGAVRAEDVGRFGATGAALDWEVLLSFADGSGRPLGAELECCLDTRQLALQRVLQGRFEEALRLLPGACLYFLAGEDAYGRGAYAQALEFLNVGYDLAAREGAAHLMCLCRLISGNCYCNLLEVGNMLAHYRVAGRLAGALGRSEDLEVIAYNTASVWIEVGRFEEAYGYFSSRREPTLLELHKLSICCERTGRREEALAALDLADTRESDFPSTGVVRRFCWLVRFRLLHGDYLERAEYGRALEGVFEECRGALPPGYASFHLPWVLEWYTASRQYKRAFELLRDFPGYSFLMGVK